MRLKIFFFPLMFVISFVLAIKYVWPGVDNLMTLRDENATKSEELRVIKEKKATAEMVNNQIKKDFDGSSLIAKYLPEQKAEDRVIAELNYIASGSQISLVNMTPQEFSKKDSKAEIATDKFGNSTAATSTAQKVEEIKFFGMKLSLVGSYEKISEFFEKVSKMSIYNSIESVSIRPEDKVGENGETVNSGTLTVEVVINFGYMPKKSIEKGNISTFSASIDTETINTLKKYIYDQNIVLDSSNKGKQNPFMP